MDHLQQLEQDLRYVRGAVERADLDRAPRHLCFVWAAIVLVGFSLVDVRDVWVPTYWAVAGPAGFAVSALIGWRSRIGRGTLQMGTRHLLHWGALLVAVFLTRLMPFQGILPMEALGPTILLLLALGYFLAGVHFDAAYRWIGLILACGYVFVLFVDMFAWLTLGVLFSVALVMMGLRSSGEHGAAI